MKLNVIGGIYSYDQLTNKGEQVMRTYTVNSGEYAAHAHVTHWDTLKRLSIIDGEIYYNTGALQHKISDRIEMFERDFDRPEYKTELDILEDIEKRQREHLRTM
jgi:hypothetical protein